MPSDSSSARGGDAPSPAEKKALLDLRSLLEDSLLSNTLLLLGSSAPRRRRRRRRRPAAAAPPSQPLEEEEADLSLWGVPLLPSRGHPATDAVLLKFLRARCLDPAAALEMLARSLRWRREFGADSLALDEEDGDDVAVPVEGRIGGVDRMGNLVCYNVLKRGGVVAREEEVVERMVRWRVRLMERGIRETMRRRKKLGEEEEDGMMMMMMLNVIDMEGMEARGVREVQGVMGRVVEVLQDNYPEFVERNIFINVSFRYYAHHALFSRFLTQRTKSKFIFARPSKVAETLLKFIAPENLPVQYGGLKREDDDEFPDDQGEVFEASIRAGGYDTIELQIAEPGLTVLWDVMVVGWDVSYKEEFIPDDECSYKVLIQNEKRLEESVRNAFYIREPGKVVLTIENNTFKRKKAYYRWKSKTTFPIYNMKK